MKIIIHAEYDCIAGIVTRKPAVVKIGEAVLTSVIPRDETEKDIINSALNAELKRHRLLDIGASEGYSG